MAQSSAARQAAKLTLERRADGRSRFHGCSRIQEYDFLGKLGEGTFGEVSKARSRKTGAVVALKKILMHNEKDGFPITALREIKLLKQLDHINILKLEEMAVERSKDPKRKPSMFMVTPYMDHDLSGLLENPSVRFTEPQIKCYMLQLLRGCQYLHENKILHRDMKAANLLINNQGILQIADFGLARPYDDEPPKPGHGGGEASRDYTCLVVTRWYRPPELLLQLRRYTTAIDMWGVGCVFGEMFRGSPILAGNSDLNQIQQIFGLVGSPNEETMPGWAELPGYDGIKEFEYRRGNLRSVFRDQDPQAISLLSELLKLDWRKRINALDALQHPYFQTHPLPARPGDLPSFEESHELDRRKFRGQKKVLPPAPAGGSVGMGPNGQWGEDGRSLRGGYRGRGHQRHHNGHGPHRPRSQPRQHEDGFDDHPPNLSNLKPQPALSLPPKPPPALDQNGGSRHNHFKGERGHPHAFGGSKGPRAEPTYRRDRMEDQDALVEARRRATESSKLDTYVPRYPGAPERAPLFKDSIRDAPSSRNDGADPTREPYAPPHEQYQPPTNNAINQRHDYLAPRREDESRRGGCLFPSERGRLDEDLRREAASRYARRRSRSPRGRNWVGPSFRERMPDDDWYRR